MITGSETGILSVLLGDLNSSNFQFYATGSRALGKPKKESDWDFYTQDTPEVREWLEEHGFIEDGHGYPEDLQCAVVYSWQRLDAIWITERIDVQCVADVVLKTKVQAVIKKNMLAYNMPKEYMKRVWKAMYELLADDAEEEYK